VRLANAIGRRGGPPTRASLNNFASSRNRVGAF